MNLEQILFSINVLVDMLGVIFFVSLIIVTAKYKSLHSTCHLLIGLYACCCLCSKTIILLPYAIAMLAQTIPFYLCLAIEIWPLLPHLNIPPLMLVIGIDRVLSVSFPIWYMSRGENKFYFAIVSTISFLYPLYLATFMIRNALANPMDPMHCDFTELVGNQGTAVFTVASFFFNISTICCYAMIVAKLVWMTRKGQASQLRFSLYRSVTLIMMIQSCGWMLSNAGYAILRMGHFDGQTTALLSYIVNYLSSLSSTLEVPVIYVSSSEHRNAFKKEFSWMLKLFSKNKSSLNGHRIGVNVVVSRNILASTMMPPRKETGNPVVNEKNVV